MIAVLSACGGVDMTSPTPPATQSNNTPLLRSPAPEGSFNALVNTEANLLNRFYNRDLTVDRTQPSQMPTSGRVTYTGMAAFPQNGRSISAETINGRTTISRPVPDMAARAVLTAGFGNGQISGTIDQFRDRSNTALPGNLALGTASINGTGFSGGTVTGTFPVNGTEQTVQSVGYSGEFAGNTANAVIGSIGFIAPQPGGGSSFESGSFIAVK